MPDREMIMNDVGDGPSSGISLNAQVAEASPVQLMLVLMNGLLDELARVRAHIEHAREEARGRSIHKCVDMLASLTSSLDFELGGNAVVQLGRVCDHCVACLNQAHRALDVARVDEVIGLVSVLRDAWQKVEDRSV